MAFAWPDGIQNKTKRLISQILWTLYLDFEGAIRDSRDAPLDLMQAMEGHGVEIKNAMTFRMILPHLDGGKYGKLITRVVIQRRTPEIRLAVRALPEDSFLPDGAGGIPVDDRIDMQLFGDTAWAARGTTRDVAPSEGAVDPARGDARDVPSTTPARGETRDDKEGSHPAREETRDTLGTATESARGARDELIVNDPARGDARDSAWSDSSDDLARKVRDSDSSNLVREEPRDSRPVEPAREPARDDTPVFPQDETDATVRRLDGELEELLAPLPVDDGKGLGPHEMLDLVVGLVTELDGLVRHGLPAESSPGRSEADWTALLEEKHGLLERLGRYMRRIKDAEARLAERNKEIEGARLQLAALNTRYERLEANNQALLAGERPAGQHLRTAEQFIAAKPSDRPDHGRSRPTRPNGRTTGSESVLAYSAGG